MRIQNLKVLHRIKEHINFNHSYLDGKNLLITCSGGVDSVVLCFLIKSLNFQFSIAHCNFSLRGNESDKDEEFVKKFADKLSVPIFTKTFDTLAFAKEEQISTQMAARDLRYDWFDELSLKHSFNYILTAHHLDDDLETFFINLSRGTGIKGLSGIPSINEKIVRPLLPFSKEEILHFAKKNKLNWREDSSNAKTDYLRNKLRLEVIPRYKEINDHVLNNFKRTREHLEESGALIDDYLSLIRNLVCSEIQDGIRFDVEKLNDLPHTNALLYELLSPYGFKAWDDISDLIKAQSGKVIYSNSYTLLKDREHLILSNKNRKTEIGEFNISSDDLEIKSPIHLTIEKVNDIENTNNNCIYIDRNKIKYPLQIRRWKEGDSFYPFGMKGNKKLSKFFKDEKLSLLAKEKIWLLLSDNQIVWVIGIRPDDRFKVDDNTQEIIRITQID